jgi:hypothetical protein
MARELRSTPKEQVEAMMAQGVSFSAVEDAIDAAQLSGRHKARYGCLPGSCATGRSSTGRVASAGRRQRRRIQTPMDDRYAVRKDEEARQ